MPKVTILSAAEKSAQDEKIRVAAYCRVSTVKSNQQHSYEAQQNYFRQLLSHAPQTELVNIYTDHGSGTSITERPDFRQMMEDCRQHKLDRIITKSLSRFARNTKDCLVALRELKRLGITVLFDKEGIDTSQVSDEVLLTILEGLAQEESASISCNIRWSLKKKMANGSLGIARVPYGYQKDERKQLLIHEEQAAVVRRIFALYLSGHGAQAIAAILNQEEIPSPTGIRWNNITILKMLRQEKYIGDIRWQKTYSVFMGHKGRPNRGQQDSYYIRDCLPPIISREDFVAAQCLRKRNSRTPKRVNYSLFRGKTRCTCGRSYYYAKKGRRSIWVCSGRNQQTHPCHNKIFFDDVYHAAWERLCRKMNLFAGELLLPCVMQLQYLEHHTVSEELKELDAQRQELLQRRYVLCELCANGCISEERLFTSEQEIVKALQSIQEKTEHYTHSCGETAQQLEQLYQQFTAESDPSVLADTVLQNAVTDGLIIDFELLGGLVLTEVLG